MPNPLLRLKLWWYRRRHPNAELLTPDSRECFREANAVALGLGDKYVESAHILLGILRTTQIGAQLANAAELEKAANEALASQPEDYKERGALILEQAVLEARRSWQPEVTPCLLLAGIIRVEDTIGARVLRNHGVKLEEIRRLKPATN